MPGTAEKDLIPDFFLDEVEDPAQVVGAYKGSNKVIFKANYIRLK